MGYDLPLDRVPSDIDSRVAFTIGAWALLTGIGRPTRLTVWTHPLLGEHWKLDHGTMPRVLRCWPHPSNPMQTLIIEVPPRG
jgi:hypothetical protein